jgi:hypothetical protein
MRNAADRHERALIGLHDHHVNGDRVYYRSRFHPRLRIPSTLHPIPWFPAICRFNGFNPLGLFHAVQVGNIYAQRKAMLSQ